MPGVNPGGTGKHRLQDFRRTSAQLGEERTCLGDLPAFALGVSRFGKGAGERLKVHWSTHRVKAGMKREKAGARHQGEERLSGRRRQEWMHHACPEHPPGEPLGKPVLNSTQRLFPCFAPVLPASEWLE